jgi:hypothetical protein
MQYAVCSAGKGREGNAEEGTQTHRIAIIQQNPHARVNDALQRRERAPHPVARGRKVVVHVVVGHLPVDLCANFGRDGGEVGGDVGWVGVVRV